jgi:hypothetical protein
MMPVVALNMKDTSNSLLIQFHCCSESNFYNKQIRNVLYVTLQCCVECQVKHNSRRFWLTT